jgi:hypothetical protein
MVCVQRPGQIAHSKDHAVGDVVKCAIELIDKVDAMKNTDGTRVFRSVPQCTAFASHGLSSSSTRPVLHLRDGGGSVRHDMGTCMSPSREMVE